MVNSCNDTFLKALLLILYGSLKSTKINEQSNEITNMRQIQTFDEKQDTFSCQCEYIYIDFSS